MKRDRKRKGRGGFTLVELMVSFALLAIVSLFVAMILRSTGSTYSKITTDINLQYEAQTAMNTIQEYILSCNDTVIIPKDNDSVLCIYRKNPENSNPAYNACKIAFSSSTHELLLYYGNNEPSNTDFSTAKRETLSNFVQSFHVSSDNKSVTLTIVYSLAAKTYTGTQTIAFRNTVFVK